MPELIPVGLIEILQIFGLPGLIVFMWWYDKKETRVILDKYKDDMTQIKRMYENNVSLVNDYLELTKDYKQIAKDLHDVIIMNTQAWQRAADDINRNQYCPLNRIKKQAPGPEDK
ncbi:MAG: hypothetical protein U5L07_07820 [Desulfobacterales bacterium]|nr:hypothetical protein [Desulfobacterales bacterium]